MDSELVGTVFSQEYNLTAGISIRNIVKIVVWHSVLCRRLMKFKRGKDSDGQAGVDHTWIPAPTLYVLVQSVQVVR